MVKLLTLDLIKTGFCIVSGFVRGIDTWAHKTVHKYNGTTVAVLGNGLDICYPGENRKLQDIPEVLSTLLMLELKNIVQQHPGKLFTKSI